MASALFYMKRGGGVRCRVPAAELRTEGRGFLTVRCSPTFPLRERDAGCWTWAGPRRGWVILHFAASACSAGGVTGRDTVLAKGGTRNAVVRALCSAWTGCASARGAAAVAPQ